MNRNYLLLALSLMLSAGAQAETLTPQQALERLNNDRSVSTKIKSKANNTATLRHTAFTNSGDPALYVFTTPAGKSGYVIVSADDIAMPMLAFADSGSFEADKMAPAMKWWLGEYARQIEWAKENGAKPVAYSPAVDGRHNIEPMIKTAWDQGEPYNGYCPIVNGARAYTGCVATSMAQIMNYFQYPAVGTGSISYNDEASGKRLSWDFSKYPFDWANMLPSYTDGNWTDAQAEAVAILMKSTGASVKMAYDTDSSGALGVYTALALPKYFGYDPNLQYLLRNYMSTSDWDEMVYENLDKTGPVLYGGGSLLGGGHSFIIDGYNAESGLYHVNWGWSEMSDGYFSLSALNPGSLGIGGGTGGGFNFDQDGVFGICKPTGKPAEKRDVYLTQFGTLDGQVDGNNLVLKLVDDQDGAWINYTPYQIESNFGVSFRKIGANDSIVSTINKTVQRLPPGYGLYPSNSNCSVDLSSLDLADGTYKLTMVSMQTNLDGQKDRWIPIRALYGNNNYITLTKDGDSYTVSSERGKFFTVDEIEFVSGLYYGCLAKMKYKLSNKHDIELTRSIAPILYKGQTQYMLGESKLITIPANSSVEGELITEFFSLADDPFGITSDTEMYVSLFEEISGRILTDECFFPEVMHKNPGLPSVTVSDYAIEGYNPKTHIIPDASDMHITATLTLKNGLVAYPLCATVLTQFDASGNAQIMDYVGEPVFLSEPGQSQSIDVHLNFKGAKPGVEYNLMLCYSVGSSLNPILNPGLPLNLSKIMIPFKVNDPAGIDNVEANDNAPVEWYNLQGLKVDFESAPAGIYIRRQGTDTAKVVKH